MKRTAPRGSWSLAALLLLPILIVSGCGSSGGGGGWHPGQPLTLDVSSTFPAGAVLRDHYSGRTATVAPSGSVTVTPDADGLVLLERDGAAPTSFTWKDATVYFAMTDRFANGDPSNDGSYGRHGDGADEVGTWHGGDLKGLAQRLDYIEQLGATALWISPPVEQVHGWVAGGGTGGFKHYGYHGYWALDFTRLDASFGTPADLQALVDGAHARGIRVIVDVVMNHPGYATGADLLEFLPEVFKDGTGNAFRAYDATATGSFGDWNNWVNYNSTDWSSWWSPTWIRANFPGFPAPGTDDLTRSLSFLPDFITEGTQPAGLPVLFTRKAATPEGTGATELTGFTVRDYLVRWHTDWVRQYGLDGFRCDTAKNVELASWKALKDAATSALAEWKAAHPDQKLDDAPFWMVGEVFPHGVAKDAYYTQGGFDALLNFDFQNKLLALLGASPITDVATDLDTLYSGYASAISSDPTFDVVSYASSHDTRLIFESLKADPARQRDAGTALLLAPGAVQVFYGDESGRRAGPTGGDFVQGTRSDMNWTTIDPAILAHWQKLGTFRRRHAAVGAGVHQRLAAPAGIYAFSRTLSGGAPDAVVVVVAPRG